MKWIITNGKTGDIVEVPYTEDVDEMVEAEMERTKTERHDFSVNQVWECRHCQEYKPDVRERFDAYGITTGHYCHEDYENNYPYRKDRYPTIEHHGYGERLGLDDDY